MVLRIERWLARQSQFSLMSSALPLLPVVVFATDFAFRGHSSLRTPLVVVWVCVYGFLIVMPLIMGRRYPRWAGLVTVLVTEGWSVIVLLSGGHAHAELNVLLQLPPIALYLGWFFRIGPALACLGLGAARGVLSLREGSHFDQGNISPAIVVSYAMLIAMLCFFGARAVRAQSDAQLSLDQLTGVLNRRGVTREGARMLRGAARGSDVCVVAIVDLDDFKGVNDLGGHAAGDALLKLEAQRLRAALGSGSGRRGRSGIVGRLGGDEFLLIKPGSLGELGEDLGALQAVAEAPWSWGAVQVGPGEGLAGAVARADAELYRAKRRRAVE